MEDLLTGDEREAVSAMPPCDLQAAALDDESWADFLEARVRRPSQCNAAAIARWRARAAACRAEHARRAGEAA
jgi:hypothetical protein